MIEGTIWDYLQGCRVYKRQTKTSNVNGLKRSLTVRLNKTEGTFAQAFIYVIGRGEDWYPAWSKRKGERWVQEFPIKRNSKF
jgi:hypothetical protein